MTAEELAARIAVQLGALAERGHLDLSDDVDVIVDVWRTDPNDFDRRYVSACYVLNFTNTETEPTK